MQPRKAYPDLHDDDQALIDIVRAAGAPLPRIALARAFSGSTVSRLIDLGHLAETTNGGVTVAPLTTQEITNHRIIRGWHAGKGYSEIGTLAEITPGAAFKRVQALGLDSASRRRKGSFQPAVLSHKARRLRLMLVDAERRGLDTNDDGRDLEHRALFRRFRAAQKLARQFPNEAPDKWVAGAMTELRQLRDLDKSIAWIAKHLGRSRLHVAQRLILEGRATWVRWQEWEDREIFDGVREGRSYSIIAARLPGRSKGAVHHRAQKLFPSLRGNRRWTEYADMILTNALVNGLSSPKRAALFPQRTRHAVRRHEYVLLHRDLTDEPVTSHELRMLKIAIDRGKTPEETAASMGRGIEQVREIMRTLKALLVKGKRPVMTREMTEEARRMIAQSGVTHQDAVDKLGVSRGALYRAFQRYPN